ncbi:hypothetical protein ACFE04_014845 [Oxalis oulophora]
MDGSEEVDVVMNESTLEHDNLTTYIDELVTSQPLINVEKEVELYRENDADVRVEEESKQGIEDLKVGGKESVEGEEPMEEQCDTKSIAECDNQVEVKEKEEDEINVVSESIKHDNENTVIIHEGNENAEHIEETVLESEEGKGIEVVIDENKDSEKEKETNGNEDDGGKKSGNEPEEKKLTGNEDNGEKKSGNNRKMKIGNEDVVTREEIKDKENTETIKMNDGEVGSENEPAMKTENNEDTIGEEIKDKENMETTKINANKRRKRGKKKNTTFATTDVKPEVKKRNRRGKQKTTLASTNTNGTNSVDQGEPSYKNKDVEKNLDAGESSGKKRKHTDMNDVNDKESSRKNNTKADTIGMIFMCSSKTKSDCYQYKVFGLPAAKKDIVLKIYKGMRLFLFDFDLKLLYGIYKAAEPGGYNIEPKAFKSAFPSQVRFEIHKDCLPVAEEKFKSVIKENYYSNNKFNCQLTSDQVKNLCKLFEAGVQGPKSQQIARGQPKQANKGPKSKQNDKDLNSGRVDRNPRAQIPVDRDRNRQKGKKQKDREHERRPASAREVSRNDRKRKDRERARPQNSFHDHVRKDRKLDGRDQERQLAPVHNPLYYCHPAPLALPLSYTYSRPHQTEIYHRASYLQDHERNRRPVDMAALRRQDEIPQIDPVFSHSERRPLEYELRHRGEASRHGVYDSRPDRSLYRDPLYSSSSGQQSDRSFYRDPLYSSSSSQQPGYYSLAGHRQPPAAAAYHLSGSSLPSDSRVSSSLPSDYGSNRLYYRY